MWGGVIDDSRIYFRLLHREVGISRVQAGGSQVLGRRVVGLGLLEPCGVFLQLCLPGRETLAVGSWKAAARPTLNPKPFNIFGRGLSKFM